jgi:hypothetical protein
LLEATEERSKAQKKKEEDRIISGRIRERNNEGMEGSKRERKIKAGKGIEKLRKK